jgi:DNA-binding FadR family transcriptional regulator
MAEAGTSTEQRHPRRRGNLVRDVEQALRGAIAAGTYAVGDKLPSESELTRSHGVSRTVVREAVSSLRLSGLVEAREGVGVFVTGSAPPADPSALFRIEDPRRLSAVIEMLELRVAVEVEAAGLAAERRSPAQAEAVRERCDDLDGAVGGASTNADLAFHLAVADATNNPQFRRMLELMGLDAIPRSALSADRAPELSNARGAEVLVGPPTEYLRQIQEEHRRIAEAIVSGDRSGARAAMREHLEGSRDRYRRLLQRG